MDLDGGEPVRNYLDCYRRLGSEPCRLKLSELEAAHCDMGSSLHRLAESSRIANSALLYAAARLPGCMHRVERVMLAANRRDFARHGLGDVTAWGPAPADKRRRSAFYDGGGNLAVQVCSLSDVDDLIPSLCAYQIEWNKIHSHLAQSPLGPELASGRARASEAGQELRRVLGLNQADYQALAELWADGWDEKLAAAAAGPKDIELITLPMGETDFQAAAHRWWERMLGEFAGLDLAGRPVFFVTSNSHSLANLISGFAGRHAGDLARHGRERLGQAWEEAHRRLSAEASPTAANLLYMAQQDLLATDPGLSREWEAMEAEAGVRRSEPVPPLLAEAQVFELSRLIPRRLDPRLRLDDPAALVRSRAVVLNTDYPLGFGAYHLLRAAGEHLSAWQGLFVLGKSAAMIGRLGDIMIPTQVRDVHSQRLFELPNCLNARRLAPYLYDAAVFDEQRSLTVHGTFLHSWDTVRQLQRADFTGIEMEAGPCLAALADHFMPGRNEAQSLVRLALPPDFSLGMLHYTSDTPYNLRASLLSHPLGLSGLESTYSCSLAIWQAILDHAARLTA
ncbi:MAG: hypothetical protein K9K66_19335 [Desulfarculaceae bacterium]|nr:hypothetical protein [Desulfarculaceae bacterium]MCF8074537.1 hypothetical protein [Desulfarculaceae bacterium]MCF8103811.1 hypothetical protein [Desulfarculaceae bacterium]MCF8117819.1 hypothetical protein [Desulfarculaceae bacterium]